MTEVAPPTDGNPYGNSPTTGVPGNRLPRSGSRLAFAYWLHLVIPALLLFDVVHARYLHMALRTDLALGIAAAVWIFAAGLVYLISRDRARFLNRARGPLLSFYAVILTLSFVEGGLRLARRDVPPAIWRPGMRLVFRPDLSKFPGASPISHFRVNEFGLRGPSLPHDKREYKIIAVGGSTALCLMLDDEKTWPEQLMDDMNKQQNKMPVWVSNAGVNGHTAVHHLMMLRSLPILQKANLVVFLVGMNDFQFTLSHEGAATQTLLDQGTDQFREEMLAGTYTPYPLYRRLRIFRFSRRASDIAIERSSKEDEKETLNETELRRLRSSKPPVAMPDLTIGLAEYRQRLEGLANECHQLGVRCLFVTQPSIWRSDLSPQTQSLLLFGWVGPPFQPSGHVSISDLERGLDSYNQVVIQVCQHSHSECLDLASILPKDSSVFYDDVHFTEEGARRVADIVANYILTQPPFQRPSSSERNENSKRK
jgi:lysophospholipase L1-like esterase